MLEINVVITEDTAVLSLDGRLDSNTSPKLESELVKVLEGNTDVVLDIAQVPYVSSAGLRVFLMGYKRTTANGREFRIANPTPEVFEVMELVGFSQILNINYMSVL